MPTYEYRCPACSRDFERFQRMSDPPGAPCPDCDQPAERLISAGGGLLFKGDGFYITDYRSDAYKDKAKEDDKATTTASDAAERGEKAPNGARDRDARAGGAERDASSKKSSGDTKSPRDKSSAGGASRSPDRGSRSTGGSGAPKGRDGGGPRSR